MKIPSLKITAKVDTNIKKNKKKDLSLKEFRRSAGKKVRVNLKDTI